MSRGRKGPSVRNKSGGSGSLVVFFYFSSPSSDEPEKSKLDFIFARNWPGSGGNRVAVDQGLRANYRKHHLIQGRDSGGGAK